MSEIETYFVAATIVTSGPRRSAMRSWRSRIASGDVRHHSLPSCAGPVAAVREEAIAVARCAVAEPVDMHASGCAQRTTDARPQVEPAVVHDIVAEGLAERCRHLPPHLVAARPDRGPERSGEAARPQRPNALGDDAGEQSA